MSSYLNPLHAPLPSEFHSQYTALSLANPPLEPPFPTSLSPSYKRVPQALPPKSVSSPHLSAPHVPITFELIGAPARGLGVPMRELVARSGGALERMIVDASEPVGHLMSGSLGLRRVSLTIIWPGYDHVDSSHSLDLFSSAGPVTRAQLAVQIAFAFGAYVAHMTVQTPSPSAAGWHLSSCGRGITFERLVLLALWNPCDEHWMAEVYIDTR